MLMEVAHFVRKRDVGRENSFSFSNHSSEKGLRLLE